MIQAAPPQARQNKELYYAWLTSNGWPREVAWDEMVKEFGKPPTKQEQADAAARAQQGAQLRQVGGAVAGTALTGWGMDKFPAPDWYKEMGLPGTYDAPSITVPTSGGPIQGPVNAFSGGSNLPDISSTLDYANPELMQQTSALAGDKLSLVPPEALNDPGFMSNVSWGNVAQGAAGAAQLYGAYQAYKSGDKTGAALSGASGAGNLALASGAASATGTLGASVIPGLNVATGLYGGYKTAQLTGDMAAGKDRNVAAGLGGLGAGAGVGLGLAGLGAFGAGGMMTLAALGPVGWIAAGGLALAVAGSALFGSKKGQGQTLRDKVRKNLKEGGLLNDQYQGTLADGSLFDFGADGKSMSAKQFNKLRDANPNAFATADSLGKTLVAGQGFSGKMLGHASGMWIKAAISNAGDDPAKVTANIKHFMMQQGMTAETMTAQIDKGMAENKFSRGQYDIYANNIKNIFGAPTVPVENSMALVRPEKGKVQRVSPGMYRDDTGKLRGSATMRGALEKAYGKTKAKA
jgi:hypothetical protein